MTLTCEEYGCDGATSLVSTDELPGGAVKELYECEYGHRFEELVVV